MKKTIAIILIIFAFMLGSIIGAVTEAKEIKASIKIVGVHEYSNYGDVAIDFGGREVGNEKYTDPEIHIYKYMLD